jgi:hypothetical protein
MSRISYFFLKRFPLLSDLQTRMFLFVVVVPDTGNVEVHISGIENKLGLLQYI